MFYDEKLINNILECKICSARLNTHPRILACGETICSHCYLDIKLDDTASRHYKCEICSDKHEMPSQGLPINTAINRLLTIKCEQVSRGATFELLEMSLLDLKKNLNQIKHCVANSSDKIKEYCIDLRTDLQLFTEEFIKQINEFNDELIQEINSYENESLKQIETNQIKLNLSFNDLIQELDIFCHKTSEYMKELQLNDEIMSNQYKEANQLKMKSLNEMKNLENIIFNFHSIRIQFNRNKLNKSILATIIHEITDNNNNKQLILNDDLKQICEFNNDIEWKLIYKASLDGFKSNDFHLKCDSKSNTLVIIRSINGNIFGGYTEQDWSGINAYKSDANAFLFSCLNKKNNSLKIKCSLEEHAIYCDPNYMCVFGAGHDICIVNDCNLNTDSFSNIGKTYTNNSFIYNSNEAKSFMAGSFKFLVNEIEVYTKEN